MITLKPRQIFRLVSIVVMIALMFSFASTMAQKYYSSLRCVTDMNVICDTTTDASANSQTAYNNGGGDEWLCSTGELSACHAPQAQGLEVVQLRN